MAGNEKITTQDVMKRIEGVVSEMHEGFGKNQTSLDSLTSQVKDLSSSVELVHDLVNEKLKKEQEEKQDLAKKLAKVESENAALKVELNKLKMPERDHTNTYDDLVLFFTKRSPLSNFHGCKFIIEDITYTSVEQYYTSQMANFFGDAYVSSRIMKQTEPSEHKRTARMIEGFNKDTWYTEDHALKVMKKGMMAKFSQSEELANFLKNTGDKYIAEACHDLYWATGVSLWAKDAANQSVWQGENHAGKLLMEVRDTLLMEVRDTLHMEVRDTLPEVCAQPV